MRASSIQWEPYGVNFFNIFNLLIIIINFNFQNMIYFKLVLHFLYTFFWINLFWWSWTFSLTDTDIIFMFFSNIAHFQFLCSFHEPLHLWGLEDNLASVEELEDVVDLGAGDAEHEEDGGEAGHAGAGQEPPEHGAVRTEQELVARECLAVIRHQAQVTQLPALPDLPDTGQRGGDVVGQVHHQALWSILKSILETLLFLPELAASIPSSKGQ